jgi:hypothetical protein
VCEPAARTLVFRPDWTFPSGDPQRDFGRTARPMRCAARLRDANPEGTIHHVHQAIPIEATETFSP